MNYIGSKLKLCQDFLPSTIKGVCGEDLSTMTFCDIFAGTGIVGRTFKTSVKQVIANDIEYYSYVLNKNYIENHLELSRKENLVKELNSIPLIDNGFIYKNYCLGGNGERQYFSDENGKKIDTMRTKIEEWKSEEKISSNEYYFLLASLLECADKVANTASVYGAYLKKLKKSAQKELVLESAEYELNCNEHKVFNKDANVLIKEIQGDILYLAPPYNQHQYGSNYHILNTIAKWDKIPAPLDLNEKGVLREKAAIRKDWVLTKSAYCYKASALEAFRELLESIDAHYILISYSTDGIIPFDEMEKLCMKKGRLSIVTNEYTTFRGGKQSNTKEVSNIEFILAIDTTKKSSEKAAATIANVLFRKQFFLLFKKSFSIQRLRSAGCKVKKGEVSVFFKGGEEKFCLKNAKELVLKEEVCALSIAKMRKLYAVLEKCAFEAKEEELDMLIELLSSNAEYELDALEKVNLIKQVPNILKKLAQKKTREVFASRLEKVKALEAKLPELYALIGEKIAAIEELASIRFSS